MAIADVKPDQEPSIEEILESIRQIISEDGQPAGKQAAPAKPAAADKPLDLSPPPTPTAPASTPAPLSLTPDKAPQVVGSSLDLSKAAAATPAPGQASNLDLSVAPGAMAAPSGPSLDLSIAPAPQMPDDDVLDLTVKVAADKKTAVPQAQAQPQQSFQPAAAIEMMDNPIMDKPMTTDTPDTLLSTQAADAATASLSKLLAGNVAIESDDISRAGKVTLEEMTRELMKPMIKMWLDQNLPSIIEKIVQKEVEKLSRRAVDR